METYIKLNYIKISGHWLKIKKLLKKYGSEIAVNLQWTSLGSAIETTHSILHSNALSRLRLAKPSAILL